MSIGIETIILITDKATLQDTVTMEEADTENDKLLAPVIASLFLINYVKKSRNLLKA